MQLPDFPQIKLKILIPIIIAILVGAALAIAAFQKKEEKMAAVTTNSSSISPSPSVTPSNTPTPTPTTKPYPTFTPTAVPVKPTATSTPAPTNTAAPTATTGPTSTPTPPPDNQPPQTRIFYPKNGGELTYKTNDQICAISEGPLDNVSNWQKIQTRYKFDGDDWSSYETMRVYICRNPLPNGSHTLMVQSKDEAGNEESAQTISFTVNISGN